MLKHYLMEALEPTLLFGIVCGLVGIVAASFYHQVLLSTAILVILGIFFVHISVNVINDYVDYKKGIDSETTKTKFSGGSSFIVEGLIKPNMVLVMGILSFVIATVIGIYLIILVPVVIPIVVVGALSVWLYSTYLVKIPFLAEPLTSLNFTLIGLGSFIVVSGSTVHLLAAILVTLPAGVMVGMAQLANELPDRKVDKKYGRRSGVVMLNSTSKSAYYYLGLGILSYASVLIGVVLKLLPYTVLIIFLVSPLVLICFFAIKKYSSPKKYEKYMGINALHGLILPCLIIIGYALVIL
jgi:1,4-dihydroxy-2-naphthoate polyprenyltransferase